MTDSYSWDGSVAHSSLQQIRYSSFLLLLASPAKSCFTNSTVEIMRASAQADIFAYLEAYCSTTRPHLALDWISHAQFEAELYATDAT